MENLVLITSIIYTPNKALSYINTRSVYTPEERFEQTKKTFQTIKEKIPNSKIFLVECSDLNKEQLDYFQTNSDFFLNLYEFEELRENIYSISKSLGEGTMTHCALKYIIEHNIQFDNFIKISGRYWLSENFDYDNFNNDKIIIKYIDNNKENGFTCLYKLPQKYLCDFKHFLENSFINMHNCIGYEVLFSRFLSTLDNSQIKSYETIGVSGFLSVTKNEFYNG